MSSKSFNILAIVAAILSVYSFMVAGDQPVANFEFKAGRKLIPSIDTDRLTSIEVEGWGMRTVLTKQGNNYVVSNRNNYPASVQAYSELVRSVLKASCDEEITEDSSKHDDLWVNWPSGRNHRVRFLDADGNELIGLIVGNTIDEKLQGHYVRLTNSNTVYRSDNTLTISSDPLNYLDKRLLTCEISDISRVELSDGQTPFAIVQLPDGSKFLEGVPPGYKAAGPAFANTLIRAPSFEFEDFAPRAEKMGLNFDHGFRVVLKTNLAYELSIAQDGEEFWVITRAKYFGGVGAQLDAESSTEEIRQALDLKEAFNQEKIYNAQHSAFAYKVHERYAFFLRQKLASLIVKDPN
ncbi:MAG: DUF4340 domain-containing protein [Planctomycetota bacterium]|jgi:hypothetical protein